MLASRLISILMVLQARQRVSAQELASELEVSVRTIYRDVDQLSAAGVPVYAERGRGGGFLLREGYRTQLTGLTPDEADTLLLAGLSGPAADLGLESALASAERKMLAALPAGQAGRAVAARQRVLLDPVGWHRRVERPPHLALLAQALWTQRRVSLHYESWTADTTRTVNPLGLVIKAGVWYLVAGTEQSQRTYKVGQIVSMQISAERFDAPRQFDLARYWSAQLKRFEAQLFRERATLRISPEAMCRIERLGPGAGQAAHAVTPDSSGWRVAEVPIEGIEHSALEILGFGASLEVVAPRALRERVTELAAEVSGLYAPRARLRAARA
jgi:predicted DNA-binding transcriptional regulator YafY